MSKWEPTSAVLKFASTAVEASNTRESGSEVQYRASVYREVQIGQAPANTAPDYDIEVDRQLWSEGELLAARIKYAIAEPSTTNPDDQYLWFKSAVLPGDPQADASRGETRYTLHVHEIDGHEPSQHELYALAGKLGVMLPFQHVSQKDSPIDFSI